MFGRLGQHLTAVRRVARGSLFVSNTTCIWHSGEHMIPSTPKWVFLKGHHFYGTYSLKIWTPLPWKRSWASKTGYCGSSISAIWNHGWAAPLLENMRSHEQKEAENQAFNPRCSPMIALQHTSQKPPICQRSREKKTKPNRFFSQIWTIVLAHATANLAEVDLVSYILLCS